VTGDGGLEVVHPVIGSRAEDAVNDKTVARRSACSHPGVGLVLHGFDGRSDAATPDGDDHGRPGSGADDSVDHEAESPLKLPHRCTGSRTEDAVDDQAGTVGVQEILQRANGDRGLLPGRSTGQVGRLAAGIAAESAN
jgi:hypothetical protein